MFLSCSTMKELCSIFGKEEQFVARQVSQRGYLPPNLPVNLINVLSFLLRWQQVIFIP
jgi:hypothetical protein